MNECMHAYIHSLMIKNCCFVLNYACFHLSALQRNLLINRQILLDLQKTIIRMIQDMQKFSQGDQGVTTTTHSIYFPLKDESALAALEHDLASRPTLQQELVSCF